jgi:hypothetical protein
MELLGMPNMLDGSSSQEDKSPSPLSKIYEIYKEIEDSIDGINRYHKDPKYSKLKEAYQFFNTKLGIEVGGVKLEKIEDFTQFASYQELVTELDKDTLYPQLPQNQVYSTTDSDSNLPNNAKPSQNAKDMFASYQTLVSEFGEFQNLYSETQGGKKIEYIDKQITDVISKLKITILETGIFGQPITVYGEKITNLKELQDVQSKQQSPEISKILDVLKEKIGFHEEREISKMSNHEYAGLIRQIKNQWSILATNFANFNNLNLDHKRDLNDYYQKLLEKHEASIEPELMAKNEILPNYTQEFVLKLVEENKTLNENEIKNLWDESLQKDKDSLDAKIQEITNRTDFYRINLGRYIRIYTRDFFMKEVFINNKPTVRDLDPREIALKKYINSQIKPNSFTQSKYEYFKNGIIKYLETIMIADRKIQEYKEFFEDGFNYNLFVNLQELQTHLEKRRQIGHEIHDDLLHIINSSEYGGVAEEGVYEYLCNLSAMKKEQIISKLDQGDMLVEVIENPKVFFGEGRLRGMNYKKLFDCVKYIKDELSELLKEEQVKGNTQRTGRGQ